MTAASAIAPSDVCRAARQAWTLALALLAACFVFIQGNIVLLDPDTQWHIAAGRLMWETKAFPQVDTMSHTYAGRPWIAKEWLSQLLLFAAWAAGEWLGVMTLVAASAAFAVGVVAWRLLAGMTPVLAIAVTLVLIFSLLGITSARPHAVALGMMALFTHLLLKAAEGDRRPPWAALIVLVVWANLHAAFTLGFVIAACVGLDAILRAPAAERFRLALLWAVFGLGCLAASCLHPYGWTSLLINIDMARGNESVPLINEWKPHDILGPLGWRVLLPGFFVLTLLLAWPRTVGSLLLGAFALYLTLRHQRFVMLLAIVAPMLSRDTLAAFVEGLARRASLFRRPDPLLRGDLRGPVLIGGLAALLALPFAAERPKLSPRTAPAAALAAVPADLRRERVYNAYNFGGFLVLNRIPTFIDGRTDQLFTDGFMARFHAYMNNGDQEAFLAFIERHGPRWAIVEKDAPDARFIANSPRWRETYADEHARVFVRVDG